MLEEHLVSLKTFLKSTQNQSLSSEICSGSSHENRPFFTNRFSAKLASKIPAKFPRNRPFFPRIWPWKSREIWLFFPRPTRSPAYSTHALCIKKKKFWVNKLLLYYIVYIKAPSTCIRNFFHQIQNFPRPHEAYSFQIRLSTYNW